LRGSSWSLESLTLCLVARLQHLLNELQHAAVGDLLSDEILVDESAHARCLPRR
jgi:hypothetical protein